MHARPTKAGRASASAALSLSCAQPVCLASRVRCTTGAQHYVPNRDIGCLDCEPGWRLSGKDPGSVRVTSPKRLPHNGTGIAKVPSKDADRLPTNSGRHLATTLTALTPGHLAIKSPHGGCAIQSGGSLCKRLH